MPTTTPLLLALMLAVTAALAQPLAPEDELTGNRIVSVLGGSSPSGKLVVRGFFIGIGFGLALALLCCCWLPCLLKWDLVMLWGRGRRRPRQQPPTPQEDEDNAARGVTEPVEARAQEILASASTTGRAMASGSGMRGEAGLS